MIIGKSSRAGKLDPSNMQIIPYSPIKVGVFMNQPKSEGQKND
jgi:hypothetical protein